MNSAKYFMDAAKAPAPHPIMAGREVEILLAELSLPSARDVVDALGQCATAHHLTVTLGAEETLEFLGRRGRFARAPRVDLILLGLPLEHGAGLDVLESAAQAERSACPRVATMLSAAAPANFQTAACQADVQLSLPIDVAALAELVEQTHQQMTATSQ